MTAEPLPSQSTAREGSARRRPAPLAFTFCLIAFFAALLLFFFVPVQQRLVVASYADGRILLALPLADGEEFSLRFRHSVNLSDVTDFIVREGDLLVCRATLFTAYGAGIPDLSDGIGTEFSQTDEGFLLSGIDKAQASIPIMLQRVPNHRLLLRGTEISLLERFGSGTLVVLAVRPVTLWAMLTRSP